jgi:hypothetical protein
VASNQALPVLRRGSTGEAVRRLQRSLVIGELLPNTGISRIFGAATERAVRGFQPAVGIGADGIVGPQTRARLPEPPVLPVLRRSSTGDAVQSLQQGLAEIAKGWEVEGPGGVDGTSGHARRRRCKASSGSLAFPLTGWGRSHLVCAGRRAGQAAGLRRLGRRLAPTAWSAREPCTLLRRRWVQPSPTRS